MAYVIKGTLVKLINKTVIGADPFGNPITEDAVHYVDNVLISPTTSTEAVDSTGLRRRIVSTELAIPKGDVHKWEDSEVFFFGHTWRTVGSCAEGIEDLMPLDWHRKIKVERYEC